MGALPSERTRLSVEHCCCSTYVPLLKFYSVLVCNSSSSSSLPPSQGRYLTLDYLQNRMFLERVLYDTVDCYGIQNIRKLPLSQRQPALYSLRHSSNLPQTNVNGWCCGASKVSTSQHLLFVILMLTVFLAHMEVTFVLLSSYLTSRLPSAGDISVHAGDNTQKQDLKEIFLSWPALHRLAQNLIHLNRILQRMGNSPIKVWAESRIHFYSRGLDAFSVLSYLFLC